MSFMTIVVLILVGLDVLDGLQPRFHSKACMTAASGHRSVSTRLLAVVQGPQKANVTTSTTRTLLGESKPPRAPRSDTDASRPTYKPGSKYAIGKRGTQTSASNGSDNIEFKLRKAIRYGNWADATSLVQSYTPSRSNIQKQQPKGVREDRFSGRTAEGKIPFTLKSGRNLVYVISETCRVVSNMSAVLPLLTQLPGATAVEDTMDNTLYLPNPSSQRGRGVQRPGMDCSDNDVLPAISSCIKNNLVFEASRILAFLSHQQVDISPKAVSLLIKGYGRMGYEQEVDKLMEYLYRRHMLSSIDGDVYRRSAAADNDANNSYDNRNALRLDIVLVNSILDAYIRCGESTLYRDESTSSSNGYGEGVYNGNTARSKAWYLFRTLMGQPTPDTPALPKELRLFAQYSTIFAPGSSDDILGGRTQLRPNIRTYNTMLKALRGSPVDSYEKLVNGMLENGLSPDSITVNTLVDACVQVGRLDLAEALLYGEDFSPNSNKVDKKHEKRRNTGRESIEEKIRRTRDRVQDLSSAPSNRSFYKSGNGLGAMPGIEAYSSLVAGLAGRGDDQGAFRVYATMLRQGLYPNR